MKQDTKREEVFWVLLRAGLSGSDCNLSYYGGLTDVDWQKIYNLSVEQGLTGVVFSAIERLPESQLPGMNLLIDWLGQVEYIKSYNEGYRKNAHDLISVFRDRGLVVRVLKGESCAQHYPDPDRRALGDLDVFLLEEDGSAKRGGHEWAYEEGNRLAEIHGARVDVHDYKHAHILWKGLMVENHRLLTTARGSQVKKEFEGYLQSLLEGREEANFDALFLTVHAYQHFMEGDLSVRQLCDWAMFVKARSSEVDWKSYADWMARLDMIPFANVLRYITHYQLSIFVDNRDVSSKEEPLSRRVLDDALYGRHETMSADNIIKYRIWQTKQIFKNSWKYRMFRNENVLVAYGKMLWYHWFDNV